MLPTIIVGIIFFAIVGFGTYKSLKSIRNNSCPGCSGGCSEQTKQKCESNR